jgi:aminoglycoside 3-N-acetyltransferase
MSILETRTRGVVHDQADLVRHLRALGLKDGDTVVARVGLRAMGPLRKPGDRTLVASMLEAIGGRGTLLVYTHSPMQWYFRRDKSYVYDPRTAPSLTGRFAQAVLEWEGAYRSSHPTTSMTALGCNAREILGGHDHHATSFSPFRRMIELGAKQLLIGCTVSSPGFGSVHYVYEQLGLANHSLLSGLRGCYFRKNGAVTWFRQRDIPGCSRGYHKFYPLYRAKSLLMAGKVGDADSYLIRTPDAVQVETEAVAKSPIFSLCENPECFECRATKWFNLRDMAPFFFVRAPKKLLKRVTRKWR